MPYWPKFTIAVPENNEKNTRHGPRRCGAATNNTAPRAMITPPISVSSKAFPPEAGRRSCHPSLGFVAGVDARARVVPLGLGDDDAQDPLAGLRDATRQFLNVLRIGLPEFA